MNNLRANISYSNVTQKRPQTNQIENKSDGKSITLNSGTENSVKRHSLSRDVTRQRMSA